jgi:protein TonB
MFESTRQGSRLNAVMYCASLLVSLVVHAAVLCALFLLPLIFFSVLHADDLVTFLIDPPPPQVPPPAPAKPEVPAQHFVTYESIDFVPKYIPAGIPQATDTAAAIGIDKVVQAIEVSAQHAGSRLGIGNLLNGMEPPKVSSPPPPPPPRTPIQVGHLRESKLIFKVNPIYPELARKGHVAGSVILEATIDEEGNVSAVKVLSGNPLLTEAAVGAVKQWKYSPTILNGEPVPVLATVTVIFQLR